MKYKLLKELLLLKYTAHINRDEYKQFELFLNTSQEYTRPQNPSHHVGSFFLPISISTKSIYLGHHKKANAWIPPGGHIELNEHPKDTVIREFKEELHYELTTESIELCTISITYLDPKPQAICKIHYDLCYLVYMDSMVDFQFDTREFYNAQWFPIDQALSQIKHDGYKVVIQHFLDK
ncbi:MAG TPA: NUDIX domain-containing protein [Candidatus Woesebacteria bacterium]|nr:NUDIX domain-containing protein [Candidatus Woesebacteria bacterium]